MSINWGDAPAWAAFIVSGGAAGIAQRALKHSKASAKSSEISAEAAVSSAESSKISAQASVRQAAAAERQVELAEAALQADLDGRAATAALTGPPPPYVAWWVEHLPKHGYLLRNIGTDTARNVEIDHSRIQCAMRGDTSIAELPPNASVKLLLIPSFGVPTPNELWVRWDGHPEWAAVPLP